jgi:hypothetical protein
VPAPFSNKDKRTAGWVILSVLAAVVALQFCGTSPPVPKEPSRIPPDILELGRPPGLPVGHR